MKIGLLDIDYGRSKSEQVYPNLALCKIAAYHKLCGNDVEWATPFEHYDVLYRSKVFNFTEDDLRVYNYDKEIRGGTGYLDANPNCASVNKYHITDEYTYTARQLFFERQDEFDLVRSGGLFGTTEQVDFKQATEKYFNVKL